MTKTAKIVETNDSYDCDTCGGSWESSVQLEIDGIVLGTEAYAHCYDGRSTDYEEILVSLLVHLGYTVERENFTYTESEEVEENE